MSHYTEITYTCPYCGKTFNTEVYDTVTASVDTDLRDRCVSGDIFQHTCPHCHHDFMIQNPLLYADADHKFLIYVSQHDAPEQLVSLVKGLKEKGYTIRRCQTVQEFVEKIQIFEDGMDDIMVELAKYDSFIEFINNRKGEPEDITSISYQSVQEGVMKIVIRMNDKGLSFLIPVDAMEEEMKQTPELEKADLGMFPCINQNWMISVFTEVSGQA